MINFEEIKEKLNKVDRFCAFNSMRLTSVGECCAEAEYDVSEDSLNGHDVVQGGAIYTLCDFAPTPSRPSTASTGKRMVL